MPLSLPNETPIVSYKRRLQTGLDNPLFFEQFQGAAQNTAQWNFNATTMTQAYASGFVTLNNGGSTTSGDNARLQSYMHIPIYGGFPTHLDWIFRLTLVPQVNSVVEMGAGFATGVAAPTDGVFFRWDITGSLFCVVSYNGTEQTRQINNIDFSPTANQIYKARITINEEMVDFYLDHKLVAKLKGPETAIAVPTSSNYWPFLFRIYNSGTAGGVQKLSISHVHAVNGDVNNDKPWSHVMARQGWNAFQGQTNQTQGQTANYANSAAPASATLSNTAAGYTTLGGQWQFAAVGGAETDYALFGWQNPAGTSTVPGKTFHCTGVHIGAFNMGAAVATTPTLMQWAAAFGATNVSLATAEAANAKAPRRITLGSQSLPVGAAIGANVPDLEVPFDTPYVAHPSEFVHLILKMPTATATGSQIVRGTALFRGYFD